MRVIGRCGYCNYGTGAHYNIIMPGLADPSLGIYVDFFCGKQHSNVWPLIGLACGIFHQQAYTLKTGNFSYFYASDQ